MLIQPVVTDVYNEDSYLEFALQSTRDYYDAMIDLVHEDLRIFKEEDYEDYLDDDLTKESRLDKVKKILNKLWEQICLYFKKFRNWMVLKCTQFEKQLKMASPIIDEYYTKVKLKGYPNICRRTELGQRFSEIYSIIYTTQAEINQDSFDYDKSAQEVIDKLNRGYSLKEDSPKEILEDWLDKVVLGKSVVVELERKDISYDNVKYYMKQCVNIIENFTKMRSITERRYYTEQEAKGIHKLLTLDISIVDILFRGLIYWYSFIFEYVLECIKLYKKDHPQEIKEEE